MDWCTNDRGDYSIDSGQGAPFSYQWMKDEIDQNCNDEPIFGPNSDLRSPLSRIQKLKEMKHNDEPTFGPHSHLSSPPPSVKKSSPKSYQSSPASYRSSKKYMPPALADQLMSPEISTHTTYGQRAFTNIPGSPAVPPPITLLPPLGSPHTTGSSFGKSYKKRFKHLELHDNSDLKQDDQAFTAITKYILDAKNYPSINGDFSTSETAFRTLDTKMQRSFMKALEYRMSLLPIFPEPNEGNLATITRQISKDCRHVVIIDTSENHIEDSRQDEKPHEFVVHKTIRSNYGESSSDANREKPRGNSNFAPPSILKSPNQKSKQNKAVVFEQRKDKAKPEKIYKEKKSNEQRSPRSTAHKSQNDKKNSNRKDVEADKNEWELDDSSNDPTPLDIEMRKLQMAKRRSVLMLNEARAMGEQSKIREQLINEMKSATDALKKSKNMGMNMAYEQHLKDLQSELTKWCGYETPAQINNAMNDAGIAVAEGDVANNFWSQLEKNDRNLFEMEEQTKLGKAVSSKEKERTSNSGHRLDSETIASAGVTIMTKPQSIEEKSSANSILASVATEKSKEPPNRDKKEVQKDERISDKQSGNLNSQTVERSDKQNGNSNSQRDEASDKQSGVLNTRTVEASAKQTTGPSPTAVNFVPNNIDGEVPSVVPVSSESISSSLATGSSVSSNSYPMLGRKSGRKHGRSSRKTKHYNSSDPYRDKHSYARPILDYRRYDELPPPPWTTERSYENTPLGRPYVHGTPGRPYDHNIPGRPYEQNMSGRMYEQNTPVYASEAKDNAQSRMVQVIAPANLPANSKFEATIGDRKFTAIVPEGGVKAGQSFASPILASEKHFIGTSSFENKESQAVQSQSTLRVVATENFPGGHTLEAELNGDTFLVAVPKDGAKKGEIFSSEIIKQINNDSGSNNDKSKEHVDIATIKKKPSSESDSVSSFGSISVIQVVSPGNLAEGTKFEAELRGETFIVTVPEGGVKKGEVFSSIAKKKAGKSKAKYIAIAKSKSDSDDSETSTWNETIPSLIQVVAPDAFPEGHKFAAELDGKTFIVEVPKGGVSRGEIFSSYKLSKVRKSDIAIASQMSLEDSTIATTRKTYDYESEAANVNSNDPLPMISVVAPDDLPGGFQFEANLGGGSYFVTVPRGGVQKGDIFTSSAMAVRKKDDDTSLTQQSMVATSVKETEENRNLVSVVAPDNLPAGYTFEAMLDGESFMVVVPEGGVRQGQIFKSPKLDLRLINLMKKDGFGSQTSHPSKQSESSRALQSSKKSSEKSYSGSLNGNKHILNDRPNFARQDPNKDSESSNSGSVSESKRSHKSSSSSKKREPRMKYSLNDISYSAGQDPNKASQSSNSQSLNESKQSLQDGSKKWENKSNMQTPNDVLTVGGSFSDNSKNSNDNQSSSSKRHKFKVHTRSKSWKDDVFCCFSEGVEHKSVWNSFFCPHVVLTQIRNRMIMVSKKRRDGKKIFVNVKILYTLTFLYLCLHGAVGFYVLWSGVLSFTLFMLCIPLISVDLLFAIIFFVLVIQTRRKIRSEYEIPGHEYQCCTDLSLALFCACCTVSQMARHTGDYPTYQAYCCTDFGLPDHIKLSFSSGSDKRAPLSETNM